MDSTTFSSYILSSNHHPYTVTPPESLASGVRDSGQEDVGRLSDVDLDAEVEVKDVVLLDESEPRKEMIVHIASNKIHTVLDKETAMERATQERVPPIPSQMFLKDTMKDIFVNISTAGNMPELMVLEGANGGVVIHKVVIAAYSKLVNQQLEEYPDCTTIYLPNYSKKIIRKMVEILYMGETFYSEEEKKDVILIWDAMRQLQISFDEKSFYYHPVEYTAVKEEDDEEDFQSMAEVDQTEDLWGVDPAAIENPKHAFSYCRVVRQPHPANPAKSVYVHSKYGEGRRIRRIKPISKHVNAEEIREKETQENKQNVEKILSKHKPVVIDLLEEEDVDDGNPSSPKKMRTQTYAPGTLVYRDETFKNLVTSGKVNLDMLKAATLVTQQNSKSCANQNQLTQVETRNIQQESHILSYNAPSGATNADRIPSVIIPPNRPQGTGIAFVMKSPLSRSDDTPNTSTEKAPQNESVVGMPTLLPVADRPASKGRAQRVRKKSCDITDIPKLDKVDECEGYGVLAAAVVPKSKVNQFTLTENAPSANNLNNEPQPCSSESMVKIGTEKRLKRQDMQFMSTGESNDEIMHLREIYERQKNEKSSAVIVVGSKKKPVPEDVKVDAYVESFEEESDDLTTSLLSIIRPSFEPSSVVPSNKNLLASKAPFEPLAEGIAKKKRGKGQAKSREEGLPNNRSKSSRGGGSTRTRGRGGGSGRKRGGNGNAL